MHWLEVILDPVIISALGKTLIHSLWQASLISLVLALVLHYVPEKNASSRYECSAFALFLVLITALCTFMLYLGAPENVINIETTVLSRHPLTITVDHPELTTTSYYSVLVWLAGFILLSLRFLMGFLRITRLRSGSIPIEGWQHQLLGKLKNRMRMRKEVFLAESTLINIPATIGYLKPMILLPCSTALHLTPVQLEAVLAHELAHIKRLDYLMNFFFSAIEILFYYHPAIWWISEQLRHERETSCDDIAIAVTGNKINYLQTLHALREQYQGPYLSMGILGDRPSLYRRFNRHLITSINPDKTMKRTTAIAIIGIAALGFTFKNQPDITPEKLSQEITIDIEYQDEQQDTFPKKSSKQMTKIKTDLNGHRYELLKENGRIVHFKSDGKKIDPSAYDEYAVVLGQLNEMLDIPPLPPTAPTPPEPPAPPTAIMAPTPPVAPTPPAPGSPTVVQPPAAPLPPNPSLDLPVAPGVPSPPDHLHKPTPSAPSPPREEMLARQQEKAAFERASSQFENKQREHLQTMHELDATLNIDQQLIMEKSAREKVLVQKNIEVAQELLQEQNKLIQLHWEKELTRQKDLITQLEQEDEVMARQAFQLQQMAKMKEMRVKENDQLLRQDRNRILQLHLQK